jgi:hypothetical protein
MVILVFLIVNLAGSSWCSTGPHLNLDLALGGYNFIGTATSGL